MSYAQAITPNPNIPCKPGWCLQYVRQTFGLPAIHPTATDAWNASKSQHRDMNFPAGVWIALWFSLANEPAGHVVLRAPDGSIYSTSSLANTPYHHPNLAHLTGYYARYGMPLVYLGWTEDVQGIPVITSTGLASMGDTTTPQEDELSAADAERIIREVGIIIAQHSKPITETIVGTGKEVKALVVDQAVRVNQHTTAKTEAVGRVTQQLILDKATPAEIVAAIPEETAQAVAELLAVRLAKP